MTFGIFRIFEVTLKYSNTRIKKDKYMINCLKFIIPILLIPFLLISQETETASQEVDTIKQKIDERKVATDSLEELEIQLHKDAEKVQARLDSLNSLVSEEYTKSGVIDTIVGQIEKSGTVYQKPDVLSKKKFRARKDEIVVIIGFRIEWFKIIHKKGIGFILQESIKHDDRIYNYKKLQMSKYKDKEEKEDTKEKKE